MAIPQIQAMRPTRPSFLRRKARIRFRTGEITIAEAADCSGPWPGSHRRPFRTTIWLVVDDRMSNQCVWHFAQRNGIAFMGVCLVSRSELAQIPRKKQSTRVRTFRPVDYGPTDVGKVCQHARAGPFPVLVHKLSLPIPAEKVLNRYFWGSDCLTIF